jgi:GTPase
MAHKAGFVNIVGSPNVGKSTLMNKLMGEKMSIVTSKAQTTRHRILGMLNEEDYQIVFSDTPGVVNSAYKLHDHMMTYVNTSLQDADVLLFITDIYENEMNHAETLEKISKMKVPVIVLVNKMDLGDQEKVGERLAYWSEKLPNATVFPISALHGFNMEGIIEKIVSLLPESPAYYDKEELSDRPMRFFVSEIIREKIFLHTKKEVPYATQVEVEEYIKGIIIGKGGEMLKRIGREARIEIQKFIDQKVFLDTFVKVDKDWRTSDSKLKKYGY